MNEMNELIFHLAAGNESCRGFGSSNRCSTAVELLTSKQKIVGANPVR